MKARVNLTKTVINNWRLGELRNIDRCRNFKPELRGYFWYECKECGTKTKFNVPTNLEQPDTQIGNEVIQSKKVPKKIFCPKCMLEYYNPKVSFIVADDAIKDISDNVPFMEQLTDSGLQDIDKDNSNPETENFFLAVFEEKVGVPIYREFEVLLKNGK